MGNWWSRKASAFGNIVQRHFNVYGKLSHFGNVIFWVSDGNPVYPIFIPDGDQIVSKTYRTRVEGENTRLRHYLARLHRQTLCYSKCVKMLENSLPLLIHYLKFKDVPVPYTFA